MDGREVVVPGLARGEEEAGLEAVQLVLTVEMLGEGLLASQQDPEHEVEPGTGGEDLQPRGVVLDGLEGEVLSDGSQSVEEEVVEVLEAADLEAHPED